MKQYFKYFTGLFIALGVVLGIFVIVMTGRFVTKEVIEGGNTERTTEERVFDYADVLSDEEENSLRKLIAKSEKKAACDIVLVTLNEPLREYAKQDSTYYEGMPSEEYVRIYADNFYDEHKYGYNKPCGDGVLLVDNWSREDDGQIHTWFTTTGKAYEEYSYSMIDKVLDNVYKYVETDPYRAYKAYVTTVTKQMSGTSGILIPMPIVILIPIVLTLIVLIYEISGRKGKKTVTAATYVNGGRPHMNREDDYFIRKHTTSRRIQTSSSGGGGGHAGGHSSSGGVSHGGGGRSR